MRNNTQNYKDAHAKSGCGDSSVTSDSGVTRPLKDATLNVMTVEKLTAAEAELRDHCIKGHRTKLKLQGGKPCHGCVTAAMQALRYKKGGGLLGANEIGNTYTELFLELY